jgi:ferritin-like metal-binding protein YciE
MSVKSMNDLFIHSLRDVYSAEKQILKALPKMIKEIKSDELKRAFETHLAETEGQITRLEKVFESCHSSIRGTKCEAIEGIIHEAQEMMDDVEDEEVLDAAILSSSQAVEHYEIARYGTLVAWADELGLKEASSLLKQTLEEEKNADRTLSNIAKARINPMARQPGLI